MGARQPRPDRPTAQRLRRNQRIVGRTVPEIAAWFTGLDLVPPGWSTFKHGDPAANSPARR